MQSGFPNHPADEDFLAFEDFMNSFQNVNRRHHRIGDSDESDASSSSSSSSSSLSSSEEESFSSEGSSRSGSDSDGGPLRRYTRRSHHHRRSRSNKALSCPVCKARHPYAAPGGHNSTNAENCYSHNARVIYASFACPICLEEAAGPPMVVLECGHAVCPQDFCLLGGTTTNSQADQQVQRDHRQQAREQRHQQRRRRGGGSTSRDLEEMMDQEDARIRREFQQEIQEAFESARGAWFMDSDDNDDDDNDRDEVEQSDTATENHHHDTSSPILHRNRNSNNRTNLVTPETADESNGVSSISPEPRQDFPIAVSPEINMDSLAMSMIRDFTYSLFSMDDDNNGHNNHNNRSATRTRNNNASATTRNNNNNSRGRSQRLDFLHRASEDRRRGNQGNDPVDTTGRESPVFYSFPGSDSDDDDSIDGNLYQGLEDDDEDDDDNMVGRLSRLQGYHPSNLAIDRLPTYPNFPTIGQWILVPDPYDRSKVSVVYYCEHSIGIFDGDDHDYDRGSCLFMTERPYSRGTRLVPNGKHGVFLYTPMRRDYPDDTPERQLQVYQESLTDHSYRTTLWNVYYVKNTTIANQTPSRRRQRGGRQQRMQSSSPLSNLPSITQPIFKFKVPKSSSLVSDGHGGIWALCPERFVPETVRRPSQENEEEEEHADVSISNASVNYNNGQSQPRASPARRNNVDSSQLDCVLIHYNYRQPFGTLVGDPLPQSTKLFMNRSGGVVLLKPNSPHETESFYSLWHVTHHNQQTLLYGGIPFSAKIVGDSVGSSVFIHSSGGRLQSILTRVTVEKVAASPLDGSTGADEENNIELLPTFKSRTCLSYDLDLPIDAIKDVVDDPSDQNYVFLHCRRPNTNQLSQGNTRWKICRVGPRHIDSSQANRNTGRDVEMVDLRDCPRNNRIVSDRTKGVWVWRKPTYHINTGDRSFLHVTGQDLWNSPCVFPPLTQLPSSS